MVNYSVYHSADESSAVCMDGYFTGGGYSVIHGVYDNRAM